MNSNKWTAAAVDIEAEAARLTATAAEYRENAAKGVLWPHEEDERASMYSCESQQQPISI